MTEEELIQLCKFFRKGISFPTEEEEELALTLSSCERNCVQMLLSYPFRPDESPRQVFDSYMEAQIGKWHPYEYNELMEMYFGREEE
jgi:hypothetical protein